ncbi:MAG TPA: ABC transporter permease [Candidatus Baltobacteraceae bacterium]|nr:ABC transporter permease [Candidatus Baltobacteraceae bacterium]
MSAQANASASIPNARRTLSAARVRRAAINGGVFVLLLACWIVAVRAFGLKSYILPLPGDVLKALWAGLAVSITDKAGFYVPLWVTLGNSALGFLLGSALGLVLGSLMAEFRPVETAIMPYAFALQSLPKVAIAPLIVIWFGFGNMSKVVIAATLTFFPMLVNSFTGLRATEPERIDLMRTLSATRLETYLRVKLPSAAPYIFAGLDMGAVYALLGTIVAEFLGAQTGMGVTITQLQAVSDVAGVFACLIVLGATGVLLHVGMRAVERRVVHWTERSRS